MIFDYEVLDSNERISFALRSLYYKEGFRLRRLNRFEEYDYYIRNRDFLASDFIVTFPDTGGKLLALKPDVTLSIIKNHKDEQGKLTKVCYDEKVYRTGGVDNSLKEISQSGLEMIGDVKDSDIMQILKLACDCLEIFDVPYILEISHLQIVSAFLDMITRDFEIRDEILLLASEKNHHGIREYAEKKDLESGRVERLIGLLDLYGKPSRVLPRLEKLIADMDHEEIGPETVRFMDILKVFEGSDHEDHIMIDFSLVGDMKYYNGIIFKGFLQGIPGSVLSGGQYDRLMRKMERKSRAIGFAVYLDMLERLEVD